MPLTENKISGRVFSKMKSTHIDKLGVSLGSRIIIEELLQEYIMKSYDNMSVDELSKFLKDKGVHEEDCAVFTGNLASNIILLCYLWWPNFSCTHASYIEKKISGKAFSWLKSTHIDQLGVSFGSRIIIENLITVKEIVSCNTQ